MYEFPTPVEKYVTVTTIYRHKNVNLNRRSHMECMPCWSVQRIESSTKTWLFPLQNAFWIETNQSREGSRTFDPFQLKALKEIWSAYHLNGIFGGFFWTNGTAPFLTKKTERIEPYDLIRSFGCKCFPAPLSSKARIMKAKVKHKNRRPKLQSFSP